MIDRYLLPFQRALLAPPAAALASRGVPADRVTIAGFLIGVLALPALSLGWYKLAFALIAANRIAGRAGRGHRAQDGAGQTVAPFSTSRLISSSTQSFPWGSRWRIRGETLLPRPS